MATPRHECGIVGRTLKRLLPTLLPKNGKRAVFLATLFIEISKISPAHRQLLNDLNRHFNLVSHDGALDLPVHLQEIIWGGRHPQLRNRTDGEEMSDEELTGLASRIISDCSEWSRYDNYQKVLDETKEVIRASLNHRLTAT